MEHDRRAALDGLARILDAGAPEDLFTGPEEEAIFLYDLLVDAARARRSRHYWEICRTARRRGVSPEFVIDRAAILLGAIDERRRSDLYRILGVPPLASAEVVRRHWLELAKEEHPDHGGNGERFHRAKQAYDVLRDSGRRVEYERFWLRVHGPFERVTPREDVPPLPPSHPMAGTWTRRPTRPEGEEAVARQAERAESPVADAPAAADADDLSALVIRARALVAPIAAADIVRLQGEVEDAIARCDALREQLEKLARLKRAVGAADL